MRWSALNYCFLFNIELGGCCQAREKAQVNYGRAIRTIRAARQLSQKQLAERACISASYISLVESGSRTPSPDVISTISRVLEVPVFLLSLFASDSEDLDGIGVNEGRDLASHLLNVLMADAKQ